jgi:hypothetical protein
LEDQAATSALALLGHPALSGFWSLLVAYRKFMSTRPESIDTWGEEREVSRSEAIRRLVELGLKAKGR